MKLSDYFIFWWKSICFENQCNYLDNVSCIIVINDEKGDMMTKSEKLLS